MRYAMRVCAALMAFGVLAGCAAGDQDPDQLLRSALRSMSQDEGVSLTFSLRSDRASLRAADLGDMPLSDDAIDQILSAGLTMSLPLDEDGGVSAVSVSLSGSEVFELRSADDDTVYVRLDLPAMLAVVGEDDQMVAGIEQMAGEALPADALRGTWLVLSGAGDLLGELGVDPGSSEDAQEQREQFGELLADVSDVSLEGSDDAGDRLAVSVNLRDVAEALRDQPSLLDLPAGAMPPVDEVPDERVTLHVWVKDDRVTQVEFDLRQLAAFDDEMELPEGVEQLAIRVVVEPYDGQLALPEDAQPLDFEQLAPLMFGAFGGFTGPTDGSSMDMEAGGSMSGEGMQDPLLENEEVRARYCEGLADMPQEVIEEHFADICPELVS